MLKKLEKYYEFNGILSTAFTCEHKDQCKNDCNNFTGPKSAFVSSGYEVRCLPRLLFLSLDSGSGSQNDKDRLPTSVRKQEEMEDVLSLHKGKHWYRTHELAWYILKKYDPDIKLQDTKYFFAHANSAKCCMNKKGRKKANSTLFKNCRKYLKGEIEILLPEIIVTQGNEAYDAINSIIDAPINNLDNNAMIIELSGSRVFWLHTYHPSCWGLFNVQRDHDKISRIAQGWLKYSELIYQHVKL